MSWQRGNLETVPDSGRPARIGINGEEGFHCGSPLEINVCGHWVRGRVELGDRLGWYWTDNKTNIPLRNGTLARVWQGHEWPRAESRNARDHLRRGGYER